MEKFVGDVVLEQSIPFAKSELWKMQRLFFEQQGINAWAGQVPFYITSNPYIANSYATITLRFIQDWIRQPQYQPLEPFYIVELGAGSGMFSFYVLKRLLELRQTLRLEKIPFVYVMTDLSDKNIEYWKKHPALQPYVQQGILDFAKFNMEQDQSLQLLNSGRVLQPTHNQILSNPVIVFANYVFDTVAHDVFRVSQGQLAEGLVTVSTPQHKLVAGQMPNLTHMQATFDYHSTDWRYYHDSELDTVLAHYARHFKDLTFLYPIASLRCLQNLRKIAQDQLFLLATDKGYGHDLSACVNNPELVFHGSFSMMVNFHAIGQYFKQVKGDRYYQPGQQEITSCAFVFGQQFDNLPETRQALDAYFNHFGPGHLFSHYKHIQATQDQCDMPMMLAHLSVSFYDPQIFDQLLPQMYKLLPQCTDSDIKELVAILPRVAANYYAMPAVPNTLFNIGKLLQTLAKYPLALEYYQLAKRYARHSSELNFNLAVCYHRLQDEQQAIGLMQTVVKAEPSNIQARGFLLKWQAAVSE
jgi:tetratricopeptide (TPR) repeat protein